jgi:hypothetical protein
MAGQLPFSTFYKTSSTSTSSYLSSSSSSLSSSLSSSSSSLSSSKSSSLSSSSPYPPILIFQKMIKYLLYEHIKSMKLVVTTVQLEEENS